jgi:hypothetical protein
MIASDAPAHAVSPTTAPMTGWRPRPRWSHHSFGDAHRPLIVSPLAPTRERHDDRGAPVLTCTVTTSSSTRC